MRIPAAGVDTRAACGWASAADGSIEVPAQFDVAGWFAEGPRPGQPGPAVVLGHVDSRTGPAVFYRVARAAAGRAGLVDRADGSTVAFRVSGTQHVPKIAFPTDLVYGPTLEPSLRLVTCGGSFDRGRGSYRDNVIVYADPTADACLRSTPQRSKAVFPRWILPRPPGVAARPGSSACRGPAGPPAGAARRRRPRRRPARGRAQPADRRLPGDGKAPGSVTATVDGAPAGRARSSPAVGPAGDGAGGGRLGRRGPVACSPG